MSDYISRDLAVKAAIAPCNKCTIESKETPVCDDCKLYGVAQEIYNHIPAADVREVVLCKDCSNRFMTPNGWHCYYAEYAIDDDDYCSCGVKMHNEIAPEPTTERKTCETCRFSAQGIRRYESVDGEISWKPELYCIAFCRWLGNTGKCNTWMGKEKAYG